MAGTNDQPSFEEQLGALHRRYLRQDIETRLEDMAMQMEETLLQATIACEFLNVDVRIEDDVKDRVQTAKAHAENQQFDELNDMIDELEDDVAEVAREVENTIQEERSEEQDRVSAMRSLNEHVEAADAGKLRALESLLSDWDWKSQVYTEEVGDSFEAKREEAHNYAETMTEALTEAQNALLGTYSETTLESVMEQLMADEPFHYEDLTQEEHEALEDAALAEYIELRLG